jgi:hypothetical protein
MMKDERLYYCIVWMNVKNDKCKKNFYKNIDRNDTNLAQKCPFLAGRYRKLQSQNLYRRRGNLH